MKISVVGIFAIGLLVLGCSDAKKEDAKKGYTNSIGMEFVFIPSGSFTMGTEGKNSLQSHEKPRHKVIISKSFYLGKYEVTQEQWKKVTGNNPSKFQGGTKPVESISWRDAKIFISRLNTLENTTKYRLSTEAEWEYAARAATSTKYSFGDDESKINAYAWYYDKNSNQTHPVGEKSPNRWGLHDMHGNVWEWVDDWYDAKYYAKSPEKDPLNSVAGDTNVIRGGSWVNSPEFLHSSTRLFQKTLYKGDDVGLRVAISIDDK